MQFFTKLLVDNILIVSGDCFNWFLSWFLNLLAQSMCFDLSSFYRFKVDSLPHEALKSPVNRNWNVAYTLSLFDHRNYFRMTLFRHHFRLSWLSAICIASNPDCECFFAEAFLIVDLPWKSLSTLTPFTASQLWMVTHPLSLPYNSFHFTLVERPSRFR